LPCPCCRPPCPLTTCSVPTPPSTFPPSLLRRPALDCAHCGGCAEPEGYGDAGVV
jgi:hypothetical protein